MRARIARSLVSILLVVVGLASCFENRHLESATRARLGVPENPDAHFDARFDEVVVRIPRVAMILDVSEGRPDQLSAVRLSKTVWPPTGNTFNMVPEGRYLDMSLHRTDRQPGMLQEDRFDVLDDSENWAGTGLRRLVYDLPHSVNTSFGTEVFVSRDGKRRALCSARVTAATRACYREHDYPELLDICYPQAIEEIIASEQPLEGRCEARQDYPGGLTVVYEFPEARIREWPDIDSFVRSRITSWLVSPSGNSDSVSPNE